MIAPHLSDAWIYALRARTALNLAASASRSALSANGTVLLYSLTDNSLHAFTINHRHARPPLASVFATERVNALTFNASGTLVLTAGDKRDASRSAGRATSACSTS